MAPETVVVETGSRQQHHPELVRHAGSPPPAPIPTEAETGGKA